MTKIGKIHSIIISFILLLICFDTLYAGLSKTIEIAIVTVGSVDLECNACDVGQTIELIATTNPSELQVAINWSIAGQTNGSTLNPKGDNTAIFQAGNSAGTVNVKACISTSTSLCATVDIKISECKKCQNGMVTNKPNGTLKNASTFCCESGEKLQKNPIKDLKKCPNKVDNPTVGKYSDGCSVPEWINIEDPDNPMGDTNSSFRTACDNHDRCYGTCLSIRGDCDRTFHNSMNEICNDAYQGEGASSSSQHIKCLNIASYYYTGVIAGGGTPFDNRQKLGCNCCSDDLIP